MINRYICSRKQGYKTLPIDIKSKTLELGVLARTTKQQWDDINDSFKNASSKNIKINITIIED
ncbi:TPA: hypothetical protein ACH1K7_001452 [Proteus mirabilis]